MNFESEKIVTSLCITEEKSTKVINNIANFHRENSMFDEKEII